MINGLLLIPSYQTNPTNLDFLLGSHSKKRILFLITGSMSGSAATPGSEMLLGITNEGELLVQIGRCGQSGVNTETQNQKRPAEAFVYPVTKEVDAADG